MTINLACPGHKCGMWGGGIFFNKDGVGWGVEEGAYPIIFDTLAMNPNVIFLGGWWWGGGYWVSGCFI